MVFEKHSELKDTHALLSPSQHSWINYTEEKLRERYFSAQAAERGTRLHAFAHEAIELTRLQPRNKDSLNMFVNDAISYKMASEQPLFYSWNCYGTADAISYRRNTLRIHDLKTGVTQAHFEQLRIYAALFCLEYQRAIEDMRRKGLSDPYIAKCLDITPKELHCDPLQMNEIILRIYQFNAVREEIADPQEIKALMDIIVASDSVIRELKMEG